MSTPSKSEISGAQVGPRELKDPRSRAYAIQTLYALKRYAESLRCDEELVAQELERIERYEHWKVLGYASKKAMLDKELSDVGRRNVEAIVLRDKRGGRPRKGEENPSIRRLKNYGTTEPYTLARLKRDHPELAAKVIAGVMSANAAAIEAGFRKKMISIPASDLPGAVRVLLRHYKAGALIKEIGRQ